MEECPRHLGD
jgi:hypothetical protein